MANIALYPGGYKPPHIGHYLAAKEALKKGASKVIVFVGPKERDGITQNMSIALWKLYTQNDPIEVRPAGISPVRDVYDFVELEAEDGDTLLFIKGKKDSEDPRFARISDYATKVNKNINKDFIDVDDIKSRTGKEVSGRLMRAYIKSEDKRSFIDGLPEGIDGEQAWNIITNLEEDLYNPNDHVLDYMKSSEFKAGYTKKDDIPPGYKYRRGGQYSAASGMGVAGTMYETDEKMRYKESALTKNWWKEQLTEVLTETKANTHLTHLEELVLTQGQDGYNQAKSFLYELIKNLKGEDNNIKNVSVKWDGAPAVWAGINPENGKFFVGIKGIFNKVTPKINYTPQDIDTNHGHAAGLVKKLKLALQYLPALGIKGILQGDFMFDSDDVQTDDIDGVTHYTFKPNTIRYAIEANSEIGKKILNAKIGVIWHTTYNSLEEGDFSFGADVSGLSQTSNVWFDDAYFKDDTGVLLSSEEEAFVLEKIKEADSINVDYDALPDELSSRAKTNMLNTYLNQEIRKGEFINDPNKSFERFKSWYQLAVDKSIEKVKRPESKERKKTAGEEKLKIFDSKKEIVLNLFRVSKLLSEAKAIFITKYDKAVATKHFIDNGDGTLRVTKAEGFVAVDHFENGIKLVDRLEFSKNNFNAGKPGAKK